MFSCNAMGAKAEVEHPPSWAHNHFHWFTVSKCLWSPSKDLRCAVNILKKASKSTPAQSTRGARLTPSLGTASAQAVLCHCAAAASTQRKHLTSVFKNTMRMKSCGSPVPRGVQGQAEQGLEQPGLREGVPGHGRGWNGMSFRIPFHPNHSIILWCQPSLRNKKCYKI